MARTIYRPEEVIKLLRLIEIDLQPGMNTEQACKQQNISPQGHYRWRKA